MLTRTPFSPYINNWMYFPHSKDFIEKIPLLNKLWIHSPTFINFFKKLERKLPQKMKNASIDHTVESWQ